MKACIAETHLDPIGDINTKCFGFEFTATTPVAGTCKTYTGGDPSARLAPSQIKLIGYGDEGDGTTACYVPSNVLYEAPETGR